MTPSRRALLAGVAGLAAGGAAKPRPAEVWTAYEARLRARRADAGGGRFDRRAERALLALVNGARRAAGGPALAWSDDLAATARAHAGDMAGRGYAEHLSPEGFDPTDRLGLVSRQILGSTSENIAYRRTGEASDAAALLGVWRRSPRHWINLLRPTHTHLGLGIVRKGDRSYVDGLFARPDGWLAAPLPFRVDEPAQLAPAGAGVKRVIYEALTPAVPGGGPDWSYRLDGAPAGVYQYLAERQVSAADWAVLLGPIFVWRGSR